MEKEKELNLIEEIPENYIKEEAQDKSSSNSNENGNSNSNSNGNDNGNIVINECNPTTSSSSTPIMFFINPISGSREGERILSLATDIKKNKNLPYHLIQCTIEETESIDCVIVNVLDQEQMTAAIKLLQIVLSPKTTKEIKVLIGGGDGTVLILVEEFQARNINLAKCVFGHVPLGTGNDLSNALGFGSKHILVNHIIPYRHS